MVPDSKLSSCGSKNSFLEDVLYSYADLFMEAAAVWFDRDRICMAASSDAAACGWFDLASLTKPLVVGLLGVKAMHEGRLDVASDMGDYFADAAGLTWADLLTHRAGLVPFDHTLPAKDLSADRHEKHSFLSERIANWRLGKADVATQYSDAGYILAAAVLEKIYQTSLDQLWKQYVAIDCDVGFAVAETPPANGAKPICNGLAAPWRVHDPMAAYLSGVAGHAGLWGTAQGVCRLLRRFLFTGPDWFDSKAAANFWQPPVLLPHARFTLGCDRPTGETTAGPATPVDAVGHLGYTGCSFWIAPSLKGGSLLLTNYTAVDGDRGHLNEMRRRVHGGGWQWLREQR